jgi:hypothetical protein
MPVFIRILKFLSFPLLYWQAFKLFLMIHLHFLISLMSIMTMGQNVQNGIDDVSLAEFVTSPSSVSETVLPESINIPVPFFSQAPLGDWNDPWQEACEEASVLLAANYFYIHNWDAGQFGEQILGLIEWEKQNLGVYVDTNMEQTAKILNEYLKLRAIVYSNPDLYQVKRILAGGHLIIMAFDGTKLNNPNYLNGGPGYHVILIKGYTADNRIITHDVGTSRGNDYIYDWATINSAMHDLSDPIENGAKKMIEILPPEG